MDRKEPEPRRTREGQGGGAGGPSRLKDVARLLGLSPATVSLVLNRSPAARSIPQETHERVFAAAKELNYRPNLVARSLRNRRTFSIGVLVPEISEGYATGVMGGIEDHLLEEGFFPLIASHRFRDELITENLALLKDRLVEGFILVNTRLTEPPELPAVAISSHRQVAGVTSVVIDHDRAATLALTHLAELGHERIAVLKGHRVTADAVDRWRAISLAADAIGIDIPSELVLQIGDSPGAESVSSDVHYREGYAYGELLLAASITFTAFFAFNDISAIGAIKAFTDAGLRVPEDVSVVGFDDIESAAFHNPSLTTVRQPLREMGAIAGRLLLERLEGEQPDADVVIVEPTLVERSSSGPARSLRRRARASD